MKFSVVSVLALASTTFSAPVLNDDTDIARNIAPVNVPILEKLPTTAGVAARAPQIDNTGSLEQLPGVVGAHKGGEGIESSASPAPTPGGAEGSSAEESGISSVLEHFPGVIEGLQNAADAVDHASALSSGSMK